MPGMTKATLIILGAAATFAILVWLGSPSVAAALEIVAFGIFAFELLNCSRSRQRWALGLLALISLLLLLTGLGNLWLFAGACVTGRVPSDASYRIMMIAGRIARGIAAGCIIALCASGQLLGRNREREYAKPSEPLIS
jgi:hypothetical protein